MTANSVTSFLNTAAYVPSQIPVPSAPEPVIYCSQRWCLRVIDNIPEAHTALGYYSLFTGNWVAAEQYVLRALEINPSFSAAHVTYSYLSVLGRQEQAILAAKRGLELDPVSPIVATMAAAVHHWAGRLDDALRYLQDCIGMNPRFCTAHQLLPPGSRSNGENPARRYVQRESLSSCFLTHL